MRQIALLCALALFVLGGYAGLVYPAGEASAPLAQAAPDNTGRNVRDRNDATLTPGDQSESEADRNLTQQIRRAVVADDALSTTAKNVKIITINGVVTLRGPVNTAQEQAAIVAKARQAAGADKVDNQLEVKGQ